MSPLYLLLFIPAVGAATWALWVKLSDKQYADAVAIGVPALAALLNVICVHLMMVGEYSLWLKWVQMVLGATIVPLAYMYFSHQIGRKQNNATTVVLWLMMLFLLIPNAVICWPIGQMPQMEIENMRPFAIYIVRNEEVRWNILTGDLVLAVQALLTLLRIIPTVSTMRKNNLRFTPKVYSFGVWWLTAIFFIIAVSMVSLQDLATTAGSWFYFGWFAMLITAIYVLFALRFDLHPIQTKEGEVITNMDTFLQSQSAAMGQRVRAIVEDEKVYLQPGFTTDDILSRLGTNRTYFTQMMQAEFGITFAEYLNEMRLESVEKKLSDKSLSMAEVAEQSGFSDANYMARRFKEKHGVSPSQWRKGM